MKNSKMKININRKPIDSHEIGRMQDFGAVMKGFGVATIPFYKKWWFATGSGVAVVGAIIVAVATLNNKPDVETIVTENAPFPTTQVAQTAEQEAFIKPAFKGFDVDYTSIWVNSGQAKSYALPSGTVIKIPACHFTNANGDAIQGKVEIRYREMNDGVDFAVSGIPMTYDSAGQEYLFESAGMFEVQGWQNGQKVFVNPNCPITIEQKTVSSGGKFNMYYLDTANRNWQYIGKPNWQKNNTIEYDFVGIEPSPYVTEDLATLSFPSLYDVRDSELTELQKEIDALEKTTWVEPKLMNVNNQNFTIEFDKNQFPEFGPFANTIFGVSDASKFSPTLYKYSWNTAVLTVNPSEEANGKSEAIGKNGYTLSLANGVYIDKSTLGNNRRLRTPHEKRPWYVRIWNSIQGWFGKKRKTNAAQNNRAPKTEEASDFSDSLPPSTFVLIPIDSTQYYYSGSGYRTPVSFTVYPVLDSVDYEKAMADFDAKLKKHDALLKEKRAKEEELKKAIARRDSLYAANMALNWKKQREEALAQQGIDKNYIYAADSAAQNNHNLIVNAFAASKFGIYNCDYPFKFNNPVTKTVTFKDEQGKNFYVGNAFIVVTNKNALMNMNYSNCCDINMSYIKKHRNIFFTVLPDDRIAYFTTEDFNNLSDDQRVNMKLRVSDKKMENINEVKTYLGLNSQPMQ